MTKLAYMTPVMSEEAFVADEYVAACTSWTNWGVTCERAGGDGYLESYQPLISHMKYNGSNGGAKGEGCGWSKNQVISVQANGAVSMTEVNTEGQGDLPCTLTDSSWSAKSYNANDVQAGQTIYWTTSGSQGRTWHHYGTIDVTTQTTNHS